MKKEELLDLILDNSSPYSDESWKEIKKAINSLYKEIATIKKFYKSDMSNKLKSALKS